MTDVWTQKDTTTHQDHVIAHLLGATFLGYFVFDEALYILLDIGFVWTILLDGEMGLLPHPVAISELDIEGAVKNQIKTDIDMLLSNSLAAENLLHLQPPPNQCQIKDVRFFASGDRRRLVIIGEEANLAIEMSLATAEVQVMTLNDDEKRDNETERTKLEEVLKLSTSIFTGVFARSSDGNQQKKNSTHGSVSIPKATEKSV